MIKKPKESSAKDCIVYDVEAEKINKIAMKGDIEIKFSEVQGGHKKVE